MPSELFKLVKCTGGVLDIDDIAIPAGFLILVLTMPQHLKRIFHNVVANNLFDNEWEKSENLRQEPVEWIKEQSNNLIIFNSFEVASYLLAI